MSRRCLKCPTSHVRDGLRHLHEIEVGAAFHFAGDSKPYRLVEIGDASCKITAGPITERRTITPRFGEPREIAITTSGVRPCAPTALVELES